MVKINPDPLLEWLITYVVAIAALGITAMVILLIKQIVEAW